MIRPGSTKATNNKKEYTSLKTMLRLDALSKFDVNYVLDCFAGESVIWNNVSKHTDIQFKRFKIDANEKFDVDYNGNALTYLKNNDIHKYNIIDIDTWGSPVKYLEEIFNKKYKGTIICTYCSPISINPDKILADTFYGDIYKHSNKKSMLAGDIGTMFKHYLFTKNIVEYKGLISKKVIYCSFKT
jgi:hypothetical protein